MLKLCKFRQLDPDAAQELLTPAVSDFMLKHKAAYGDRHVRPKHHWLYDVIESAFRHGMLKDMWIIERLHLRVKGEAELVRNTVSFEKAPWQWCFVPSSTSCGKATRTTACGGSALLFQARQKRAFPIPWCRAASASTSMTLCSTEKMLAFASLASRTRAC